MGVPYPHLHHHHNIPPYLPVYTDTLPSMPGLPTPPPFHTDPIYFTLLPTYPMPPNAPIHDAYGPIPISFRRGPPTRPRKPFHPHPHSNQRRAIFIQNLHPATTSKDLKTYLHQTTGPIEACEVFSDPETGRCKGYARVTFQNAEEAKRAAWLFNGDFFLGLRIRVRLDRFVGRGGWECGGASFGLGGWWNGSGHYPLDEQQAVPKPVAVDKRQQQQQPLVVNGSGVGGRKVEDLAELG